MQVVNATRVLDPQPGLQEWLDRGDGCYSGPEQWQGFGEAPVHANPGSSSPQPLAWGPHRQVHKTQGGDDAADEANDEGAIGHEHHFSGRPDGHPSCERGVLDVHLGRAGRVGRSSVLSPEPACTSTPCLGALALGGRDDSEGILQAGRPQRAGSCALCTLGTPTSRLAIVHGHKSV